MLYLYYNPDVKSELWRYVGRVIRKYWIRMRNFIVGASPITGTVVHRPTDGSERNGLNLPGESEMLKDHPITRFHRVS